jgi:hypothetical protein
MVLKAVALLAGLTVCTLAFDDSPTFSKIYERDLSTLESEFVSLVDAMPPEKFEFVPTKGEFAKSRTFAQQATHVATVLYEVSAGMRGEKSPVDAGVNENGAPGLNSKDAIVKYVKDAFAYAHKAMAGVTDENIKEMVKSPFESGKSIPRIYLANVAIWHSYDHYGQMVIYLRMNGIVPPASR